MSHPGEQPVSIPAQEPGPDLAAFEAALQRHVLHAWFPRSLDTEYGGFLCDFDRTWRPNGPHDKLLEFQARQTLTAADAFRAYPADQRLREAALHGFRYLRDVMWDPDGGGWFHRLDRAGRPQESHTKHTHGFAYAIEACAAVYHATGESSALELAQGGFDWLDHYARDAEYGGYFGFLTRDGTVIRERSQCPWQAEVDTIGTEIGLKDANVHSDLVETFVELYRVWPDPRVAERLAEVLEAVSEKMLVASSGVLHIFVTPDWKPIPHLARAPYQCQTAYRLTLAKELAGNASRLEQLAVRMVDQAVRLARDPAGGFFYGMPGAPPLVLQGSDVRVRSKIWWGQFEALKALLAVSRLRPEASEYRREFVALWRYLQDQCFDARHGGVFACGLDSLPRRRRALGARFAPGGITKKGDVWKDASHDGRALLYCVEHLREATRSRR